MKLAVLLYGDTSNPKDLPTSWPAETFVLTSEQEALIQDGYYEHNGINWLAMTQEEYDSYVSAHQSSYDTWYAAYQASTAPTAEQVVRKAIAASTSFGAELMMQFATENVLMGITQAGKVGPVTDYLHKLSHYISTGSLYQAITEIDTLISNGISETLSPFVTEERLLTYKAKIQAFLA